mmetsp:Transcript_29673/g.52099  ORF Transcript_29673/g.52099 Transcript_29673/m.52099 type:complete len:248 (+) Transcript_29673:649-1392(+)
MVKEVEQHLRAEPREALHGSRADLPAHPVVLERLGNLRLVRHLGELVGHHVGVLDGHAAALAEVRHHRMEGVPHQSNAAVGPAPHQLRGAVVKRAALDDVGVRRAQHLTDLGRPFAEDIILQPRERLLLLAQGRVGVLADERVPLQAAAAYVRRDEVLFSSHEDRVPHIVDVLGHVVGYARIDLEPRVGRRALVLVVHLRAHLRPDPVRTDHQVGGFAGAVVVFDFYAALRQVFVAGKRPACLHFAV